MATKKLSRIIVVCAAAIMTIVALVILPSCAAPEIPVLVTHECTDHGATFLTAHGEVTGDGGSTLTRRGFYYDTGPLYGIQLDGTQDRIVLPAESRFTGAFTVAIWCKPEDWEHADRPMLFGGRGLLSYEDGTSGLSITGRMGELYFDLADGFNEARRTVRRPISDVAPIGEWSFIVVTNSGLAEEGGLKVWRNSAALTGSATGAESVRWIDDFIALGHGNRDHFKGTIGEVRIYDRELGQAEIGALYDGENLTQGLIGFWKLDEGEGDIAHDASGLEMHGELEGSPEWFIGGHVASETGAFGSETYSLLITGLRPDASYRVMAFGENEAGIGYGNVVTCRTLQ